MVSRLISAMVVMGGQGFFIFFFPSFHYTMVSFDANLYHFSFSLFQGSIDSRRKFLYSIKNDALWSRYNLEIGCKDFSLQWSAHSVFISTGRLGWKHTLSLRNKITLTLEKRMVASLRQLPSCSKGCGDRNTSVRFAGHCL